MRFTTSWKLAAVRALLLTVVIVGAIVLIVRPWDNRDTTLKQKGPSHAPCSTTAAPCIKITQSDGTIYQLNDFRFVTAGHCVLFISLPDNKHRETCGDYHLDWIGPVPKSP